MMTTSKLALAIVLTACAALVGCDDSSAGQKNVDATQVKPDVDSDGSQVDVSPGDLVVGTDQSDDTSGDTTTDQSADTAVDTGPDAPPVDVGSGDATDATSSDMTTGDMTTGDMTSGDMTTGDTGSDTTDMVIAPGANCGDGNTDTVDGEECDDGNSTDGDGCSRLCLIEVTSSCGDGTWDISGNEECDDGNTSDGDGCSANCQIEPPGGPTCGDGTLDFDEKCDDGNLTNGDGCNPTCNLTNTVTLLANNVNTNAIAADDKYLWYGFAAGGQPPTTCELRQIDIDACINQGNCAQTVVAGGSCGTPTDGNGTNAVLSNIGTLTTDGKTVWFSNQHTIRAFDIATGDVTTVAGRPNSCAAVDGTGSDAYFHDVRGLTYYNGMVYLVDGCENTLRELNPTTGEVVTLAGQRTADPTVTQTPPYTCMPGFSCQNGASTDGNGTNAIFGSPRYMTSDNAGTLYITDTNSGAIRTFNIATKDVGTIAGGGGNGYVDSPGTVEFNRPRGMTSDGSSVYVGEQNAFTFRQIQIASGNTSTAVGARGCNGARAGQGGDGSRDYSANCGRMSIRTLPRIDTPFGALTYHFPSRSILYVTRGQLGRIE